MQSIRETWSNFFRDIHTVYMFNTYIQTLRGEFSFRFFLTNQLNDLYTRTLIPDICNALKHNYKLHESYLCNFNITVALSKIQNAVCNNLLARVSTL